MKITLSDIVAGFASTLTLNTNNGSLEEQLNEKVLYRDNPAGEPNQMENDLDMNSNRMLNLPVAVTANEPLTLGQYQSQGQVINNSARLFEVQTATEGQTVFTLSTMSYVPGAGNMVVIIQGVYQHPGAFAETDSTTITLSEGVSAGEEVLFVTADTITTAIQSAASVTYNGSNVNAELNAINATIVTLVPSAGSPEGVVSAPVGRVYTRSDGGAGTTLYVKESGTGNTGWVGK